MRKQAGTLGQRSRGGAPGAGKAGRWAALGLWVLALTSVGRADESGPRAVAHPGDGISLDGTWNVAVGGQSPRPAVVPGLVGDPNVMSPGAVSYARTVALPPGDWSQAVLRLYGARFEPAVYVDGTLVGAKEGGMGPVRFVLRNPAVQPGRSIDLRVVLKSLRDVPVSDASSVPRADRWRADVSSSLWGDVSLHFAGRTRITRLVPWTNFAADSVAVHWELAGDEMAGKTRAVQASILDSQGRVVAVSAWTPAAKDRGVTALNLDHACQPWSPEAPHLYRLRLVVRDGARVSDRREITWGLRDFRTRGLRFILNGHPIQLRGSSVVWHRWVRDPAARTLAFDPGWFEQNIIRRLKRLGANYLRFHLGLPPEAFLDRCDRDGLLVQMEWPFFHGIPASGKSMEAQWRSWLDVAARHPCVVMIQPWNETAGPELTKAWHALNADLADYPPIVVCGRDVINIHKYWWSLFENLGLYYDSPSQFPQPIMVDEFGGNYLDSKGDPGAYPTVRESLLRFIGRRQTRRLRLWFQGESTSRVAEYWRRLGAAGFAPFCMLSSPQDGDNWFLGPLKDGRPKPVWGMLSAAFAPVSVSLALWDHNFRPGQVVTVPVYLFNDTNEARPVTATVLVAPVSGGGPVGATRTLERAVPAHGRVIVPVAVALPPEPGRWRMEARLEQPKPDHPVVSAWDVQTLRVEAPTALHNVAVGVPEDEGEIRSFLAQNGIKVTTPDDPAAAVIVTSKQTWARVADRGKLPDSLPRALARGVSLVMLDIGPHDLGQGYKVGDLGPLEGAPQVDGTPRVERYRLVGGVHVTFEQVAEPESCLHPALHDASLWHGLSRRSAWLWNGLRGGLVVPAADMTVTGLSPSAALALWTDRGADPEAIRHDSAYYAYELQGFYAFSRSPQDREARARLRAKVKVLVEDAPALNGSADPEAPIVVTDIAESHQSAVTAGRATLLRPLASCGKDLDRIPVVELAFGPHEGKVILSQLLTAGRLVRGEARPGFYGIRYDPAAAQLVLNLIADAIPAKPSS